MPTDREIHQIEKRLQELQQHADPTDPFDWDDVEYLRLQARKLELGYGTHFSARWFDQMAAKVEWTLTALEESVKLQSHYARLLNGYDGGERIGFESAGDWIARLKELGEFERETRRTHANAD